MCINLSYGYNRRNGDLSRTWAIEHIVKFFLMPKSCLIIPLRCLIYPLESIHIITSNTIAGHHPMITSSLGHHVLVQVKTFKIILILNKMLNCFILYLYLLYVVLNLLVCCSLGSTKIAIRNV